MKKITINNTTYELLEKTDIFEVGYIYISISPTNPGTKFGGTWQLVEEATLIGASNTSSSIAYKSKVGQTIGSNTATLTVNNMPSHGHEVDVYASVEEASGYCLQAGGGGFWDRAIVSASGNNDPNKLRSALNTGGGQAFSIVQKSLVCYIWRRVS